MPGLEEEVITLAPVQAAAKESKNNDGGWVSLSESERSSFAGIHGGTTPVSVMGTETQPGLETVSGRTGDDFVQVLEGESAAAVAQAEADGRSLRLLCPLSERERGILLAGGLLNLAASTKR